MGYATQAQVQTAVGGAAALTALTDLANADAIDPAVVSDAIAEADAVINSYAGKRYKIPIVGNAIEIARLSARMAARILRRNRMQVLMSDADEEKLDRAWLKDLSEGRVTLSTDTGTPADSPMVVDKAGVRESTKNVSRNRMKGYW